MKNINYDFSNFLEIYQRMIDQGPRSKDLKDLQHELNNFFKDGSCKEVLYTNNTNNEFFGMVVHLSVVPRLIYDYLVAETPMSICDYYLEIDSKLFDPLLNLDAKELLAITLHEVGHLVGSSIPIEQARHDMDAYLASNREHIKISDMDAYREILAYGLTDYLSKCNSMFYTANMSELSADEFVNKCGFSNDLLSAYDKIVAKHMKLYRDCQVDKFTVFAWTLNVYKNLKIERIGALKVLNRAKVLTGSRLQQKEITRLIDNINRAEDDEHLVFGESTISDRIKERLRKHRLNNLKTIDSVYYELAMRIKNVEDEDDALYLMRQINNNIAVIEEYKNSKDCDEYEFDKWSQVLTRFEALRDKLSSSIIYKNKNYGLFVNYPDIVENRY